MRLSELIERLQEVASNYDGDIEVVAAIQPNYPLAVEVDEVTLDHTTTLDGAPVLWIATGAHPYRLNPYAPKHAWDGGEVEADEEEENDGR